MELKTKLYFSSVHTNTERKLQSFSKTLFKPEPEIWKRRLCILDWTENILKPGLLENDVVSIIIWFAGPSFPRLANI